MTSFREIWLLPMYALLTLVATLTHQPDPETEFHAWSEYVTTSTFFVSHVVGSILATALLILGVFALAGRLSATRRGRTAHAAAITTVVGTTGVLAMFGVAAFAQPAIGQAFLSGVDAARDLHNDVFDAATLAVAVPTVLLFSVGIALLGWATAASAQVPKWASISLGLSGPFIGILGLALGTAQTIGSLLLLVGGTVVARSLSSTTTEARKGAGPDDRGIGS